MCRSLQLLAGVLLGALPDPCHPAYGPCRRQQLGRQWRDSPGLKACTTEVGGSGTRKGRRTGDIFCLCADLSPVSKLCSISLQDIVCAGSSSHPPLLSPLPLSICLQLSIECLELLDWVLCPDPHARMTATQILQHPWVNRWVLGALRGQRAGRSASMSSHRATGRQTAVGLLLVPAQRSECQ